MVTLIVEIPDTYTQTSVATPIHGTLNMAADTERRDAYLRDAEKCPLRNPSQVTRP